MLGHLLALIPGEGVTQLRRQAKEAVATAILEAHGAHRISYLSFGSVELLRADA